MGLIQIGLVVGIIPFLAYIYFTYKEKSEIDFLESIAIFLFSVTCCTGIYLMYVGIAATGISFVVPYAMEVGSDLRIGIFVGGLSLSFHSLRLILKPFTQMEKRKTKRKRHAHKAGIGEPAVVEPAVVGPFIIDKE